MPRRRLYNRPVFYFFPDGPFVEMRGEEVGEVFLSPQACGDPSRRKTISFIEGNGEGPVPNKLKKPAGGICVAT